MAHLMRASIVMLTCITLACGVHDPELRRTAYTDYQDEMELVGAAHKNHEGGASAQREVNIEPGKAEYDDYDREVKTGSAPHNDNEDDEMALRRAVHDDYVEDEDLKDEEEAGSKRDTVGEHPNLELDTRNEEANENGRMWGYDEWEKPSI